MGKRRNRFRDSWREAFSIPRKITDDQTLVDVKKGHDAAEDGVGLFFFDQKDSASPLEADVVEGYCLGTSPEDVKNGKGPAGSHRNVWLDARHSFPGVKAGAKREYKNPLTATGLLRALEQQQFNHEELPDATRRLIYISDLSPDCIHALAATVSLLHAPALRNAIYRHLAFRPSIAVKIESVGFLRFQLELHLPFFILGPSPPPAKTCETVEIKPDRAWTDVSFLKLDTFVTSIQPSKPTEVRGLQEAQVSLVIAGTDDWRWTAYGFVDTEVDGLLTEATEEEMGFDQIAGGEEEAKFPIWGPRDYFVRVAEVRINRITQNYENLMYKLNLAFEQYMKEHPFSLSKRPATSQDQKAEMKAAFDWALQMMSLLQKPRHVLLATVEAWRAFDLEEGGDMDYFDDSDEDVTTEEVAAQRRRDRSIRNIEKMFCELREYHAGMVALIEKCSNYKNALELSLTLGQKEPGNKTSPETGPPTIDSRSDMELLSECWNDETEISLMGEEHLVTIVTSPSAVNEYDSDPEKDEEIDSEVSSIFSRATIDSGTYASSVPLLVVQGAEDEWETMLVEDEILEPLYKIAAAKLKPERFERNFARLLKMYADDLREGASDDLQRLAIGLVRSRRRPTAKYIRLRFFTSAAEESHVMDELRSQSVDRSVHLKHYLGQYIQSGIPGPASEVAERNSDAGDSEPDSGSGSSEEGDRDSSSLPSLEHIRGFMTSGNALPNLRDRLRAFLEPQPSKKNGLSSVGQLDTPTNDNSIRDQSIAETAEGSSRGLIAPDHIPVDSLAEIELLDLQSNVKEYSRLKPEPGNKTPPETGPPTIDSCSDMELLSECCNDETEISLLAQAVIWLQDNAPVFASAIVSHFASAFVEPALSPGLARLRWTCRCGHVSHDDFVLLSPDGLQHMADELKSSGVVDTASIDASAGSAARGTFIWTPLFTLHHRIQRSLSRKPKGTSLPVSENQTRQARQHSHQLRPECKFLQVCVEKGPYSTRMHYIDVCDKKTDQDIFRTLRKDYKDIRRELNSLLFKIRRIDFVEFQIYPKELVDSLIPDQLPPPAPENLEYEYSPMPPRTKPPVPQNLMMHLWHCREEFAPGDFFSKRFPKKKSEPCKFVLDDNPTANVGWGLHIVETPNIPLILWILFGLTSVSGLVFGISWSLLRNDVSGAFTISSYITAWMTLLVMAVMSVLTRI